MKKIMTLCMVAVFFMTISAPAAFAGSKQRHRWQGVAIGLGAAILGNAILNSDRYDAPPERVVVDRDCRRPRYWWDLRLSPRVLGSAKNMGGTGV